MSAWCCWTVYFLVLNFFLLFEIQPRPLRLDMASSHYALDTPGAELQPDLGAPERGRYPRRSDRVDEDPTRGPAARHGGRAGTDSRRRGDRRPRTRASRSRVRSPSR